MLSSLSYSALAAACFSSSVIGLRAASRVSRDCNLSARCRSRSFARSGSTWGKSVASLGRPPGGDLRRLGDGERDGGERFRTLDGCGEYDTPGGGVGTRTADCKTTGSDIWIL